MESHQGQERARFGESEGRDGTGGLTETFTTQREGQKHEDASVTIMTVAGRTTEGGGR